MSASSKPETPSRTDRQYLNSGCATQKPDEGFEPFITKAVVAARIDVEIHTVARLMRRGVLRHYKIGPVVRFKWSEVESDLREHFHVVFDPRRPASHSKTQPQPQQHPARRAA